MFYVFLVVVLVMVWCVWQYQTHKKKVLPEDSLDSAQVLTHHLDNNYSTPFSFREDDSESDLPCLAEDIKQPETVHSSAKPIKIIKVKLKSQVPQEAVLPPVSSSEISQVAPENHTEELAQINIDAERLRARFQAAKPKPSFDEQAIETIDIHQRLTHLQRAKKHQSSFQHTQQEAQRLASLSEISLAEMEKRLHKPLRNGAKKATLPLFAEQDVPEPETFFAEQVALYEQNHRDDSLSFHESGQQDFAIEDDEFAAYYQMDSQNHSGSLKADSSETLHQTHEDSSKHNDAFNSWQDTNESNKLSWQKSENTHAANDEAPKNKPLTWRDMARKEVRQASLAAANHQAANASSFADSSLNNAIESFRAAETFQAANTIPPLSLLSPAEHNPAAVQSQDELLNNSIIIEEKLAEYRVKVKVQDFYAGPVITRYEIEPDVGVRGSSVLNLEKDLARSLGVSAVRVVETIPGTTCMGLELPNPQRQIIRLSEILNSSAFVNSQSKLTLALGLDITGQPVVTDLASAPHLLVAGTTGSGKSVGVNSMILSMIYKAEPSDVRMIMIDPKMLELSIYEGIPHLLAPVVTDMKLAANALNWCVNEMEKRYRLMSHLKVRNIKGYNDKLKEAARQGQRLTNPFSFNKSEPEPLEKLPYIVVVVDEFADLMMVVGKQIELLIARLAQKARAAGIHLIFATQRPSVDVITGVIKANLPTRIAFQVSSKVDSRTVLDQMGAENLLGKGDMLFLPSGLPYPQRVHGAFVADNEVHAVVEYLKQFGAPNYIDDVLHPEEELNFTGFGTSSERDDLFDKAVESVIRMQKISISALQRYLKIGYNRAATLMEQLESEGIVSTPDSSGKRVLLSKRNDDLDQET